MTWILIAVCGGLGAVGRYLMEQHLKSSRGWSPLSTVSVINLLGSALLGLLGGMAIAAADAQPQSVVIPAVLSAAALCGGFTTFSTAMVEALKESQRGKSARNLGFALLGSIIFLGTAGMLGQFLGSLIFQVPYFPV